VPIAEAIADDGPPATALALFPTKALAHDQLRALGQFDFPGCIAATYDGDTDPTQRSWVRSHANVILTNPEMLHLGMLPNHRRWGTFFRRLRYVVIDELHVFRGVFGSHMAHVLRRLRRIAEHYGSDPVFIFSSATIGQPDVLATELCGVPVTAVTDDGSPQGPRRFALLNPPLLDETTGVRSSTTSETSSMIASLVDMGHRTIAFTASRKGTELVAGDVRRRLETSLISPPAHALHAASSTRLPGLADREPGPAWKRLATTERAMKLPEATSSPIVRSYRSGYLSSERREIETEMANGDIAAIVATSALELGVDIGGLDACVLSGFPGTIASMWQQAGRAGREGQLALSVLIAGDDQLDQWLMAHPRQVFDRPPEPAVINVGNPFIAHPHLCCAAAELPLTHDDDAFWPGELLDTAVHDLVLDNDLLVHLKGDEPIAMWNAKGSPARRIGLRSGSSKEIRIELGDGTLVGTVDDERAPRLVHTGAVYLHRGETFEVTELNLDGGRATVRATDGGEYTQPRSTIDISVLAEEQHRFVGPSRLALGQVEVTTQVTGYQRKERRTRKILGNHQLDLPPQRLITRSFWYTVDDDILAAADIAPDELPGTLHAAEHGAIGLLPLFTICDRWDVGGVSTAYHPDTDAPTIFIYDGYPGGTGIAELGFDAADRHLKATLQLIEACGCEAGCPSCVQSPKCGNGNEPLDKAGAVRLLSALFR